MTIILQDTTQAMCSGLANGQTTANRVASEVSAKGVDGVNIDYEGVNEPCGASTSRALLTSFVQQVRTAIPGLYLSIDTYASSAADSGGFFDIGGLSSYVDSFFVMAYDLDGNYTSGNWQYPPLNCSSYCFSPTAPLTAYHFNDTNTVNQYLTIVPAAKIILGVPYYGYTACVAPSSASRPGPNAVAFPSSSAQWAVPRYLDSIATATTPGVSNYATSRDTHDTLGQEPFSTWLSSTRDCWRESYWDDVVSLGQKYDLVKADNLRGVGIFALDYGGGAVELWSELQSKFGFQSLSGSLTSAPAAASWGGNRLDVFARGTDNALWHRWWDGSAWSNWESLGGVLTSGPAAVSWGPNRIDVLVRGTDNALWHTWWDGSAWRGWESQGGQLNGSPSAAAWASNRLDLFVRGTDDGLWHKWWDGVGWSVWVSQGGLLTESPGAVSWGPGRIDVFVRGTDNGLWHTWWDGNTWNGWESGAGALTSGPAPASTAVGHLDIFARGTDNGLWRRSWSGTAWSSWSSVGGNWKTGPAAVSRAGSGQVDVFVVGTDNGLWQATL